MVAYDGESESIRHYRVDKMTNIAAIDVPRHGAEVFRAADPAQYSRKVFGMYAGREQRVQLRFANHLVGAVLDRLGQDVSVIPDGDAHFLVSADIAVSPQFFAWVTGFGDEVRVTAPESVVSEFRAYIARVAALYE